METTVENQQPVVSIGIDAAVVASHQVAIRGPGIAEDFRVSPTLAGLEELTVRLSDWAPAMVVAEPTAGTWLPLLHAIRESGCRAGFVANRDSARLRKAIAGANKTDVIDADMLARSPEILGVDQPVGRYARATPSPSTYPGSLPPIGYCYAIRRSGCGRSILPVSNTRTPWVPSGLWIR